MFAVTDKMAAVCGRYGVHIQPFASVAEMGPLDIANNLPKGSKADPTKLSLITLDLSPDSRFLAAADSGKNVFLFEFTLNFVWDHLASWTMKHRTAKLQFDRTGEHILITDKIGDVYMTRIGFRFPEDDDSPGMVTISTPRKILAHDHHVLDVVLSQENQKILTCSSDETIRLWTYPTMIKLDDLEFKVDHKESIVSSALVNRDQHLISISADGTLKFWRIWLNLMDVYDYASSTYYLQDSSNPMRKSHKSVKVWNIFTILGSHRGQINEVVRMASTTFEGRVYIAVQISGFKELPVFELRPMETTFRLFGQARLAHNDYIDISWRGKHLFVFCPEEATMCKYAISSHGGGLMKEECALRFNSSVKKDIAAYGTYNRPFFPVKKRVLHPVIETVAKFDPLPTEEEDEAALLADKKLKKAINESREAYRLQLANNKLLRNKDVKKKKGIINESGSGSSKKSTPGMDGRRVQFESDLFKVRFEDDGVKTDDKQGDGYDYDDQFENYDDDYIEKFDGASSTHETTSNQTEAELFTDADDADVDDEDV